MARRPLVALVDDDESVRESLPDLLSDLGFAASVFESGEDFLASADLSNTACLILDVAMPGLSGPDLHQELIRRGHDIPTIFITARADESLREKLLRQGAVACLFKPFNDAALRAALDAALPSSRR